MQAIVRQLPRLALAAGLGSMCLTACSASPEGQAESSGRPLSLAADFDAWQPVDGLYACGPFRFDEADADDYHSRLLRWWQIPSREEGFVAYSTCSRATTLVALEWMETVRADLERLFGLAPEQPVPVILLRSLVQYNAFAITQPGPGEVPPELAGRSAFHHAFPCESWLDVARDDTHPGAAAAYWDDRTEAGNRWGPLAARCAAALATVEALDPSPAAVAAYRADPARVFPAEAYWAEKRLPLWLHYGAALYCERFFLDGAAEQPLWARRWSLRELESLGGLEDLRTALACELAQDEVQRSRRRILQAGALVAFLLDAPPPAVAAAHDRLRIALRSGEDVRLAVRELERALLAHEDELRAFATP